MLGHPGGEAHSRYLIELSFLEPGSKWLDMGAGDGSTVRLLRELGYEAEGIDLVPRGEDARQGDYLHAPYAAGRMLHRGGKLVFSDVTENVVQLLADVRQAGFAVRHLEDLTDAWKEYYLEALWTQDNVCRIPGKKVSYVLFVCERM